MNNDNSNPTGPKKPTTVVYACSGCSDAGEIADRVARQLTRDGAAQMSCLAGIGGRVKSLVMKAENAERILVVDGCPLNCAAHTLKLAGFQKFDHLELHKIGIRKGSCPVNGGTNCRPASRRRRQFLQMRQIHRRDSGKS